MNVYTIFKTSLFRRILGEMMRRPNLQSPLHSNKDEALHEYAMIIKSMTSHFCAVAISSPGNLSLYYSHWEMAYTSRQLKGIDTLILTVFIQLFFVSLGEHYLEHYLVP